MAAESVSLRVLCSGYRAPALTPGSSRSLELGRDLPLAKVMPNHQTAYSPAEARYVSICARPRVMTSARSGR